MSYAVKRKIVALLVCLAFIVTLGGCGGNQSASAPPEEKKDEFPTVHWTMTTSWPQGMIFFKFAEHFAEEVKKMSGGKFTIDVQPGGAIVGALEALDATHKGTVQIAHTCANYAMGKHPSAVMFASIMTTFDPVSHLTWIYEGGGLKYWQQLYQEKLGLNVVTFPVGICGPDLLAWSNKELSQLDDWKGLKYRTISWWGEVLKSIGVSVTSIPGAEIYQSLERGVIDAVEYATPTADYDLKFYEVAKYFTGPGVNQPDTIFELDINKDEWNKLPEAYQAMIEVAARSTTLWALCYDNNSSMEKLDFYEEKNVKSIYLAEEEQAKIREIGWQFIDEQAAKDPFLKEVWDSARAYYLKTVEYDEFMKPINPDPAKYKK